MCLDLIQTNKTNLRIFISLFVFGALLFHCSYPQTQFKSSHAGWTLECICIPVCLCNHLSDASVTCSFPPVNPFPVKDPVLVVQLLLKTSQENVTYPELFSCIFGCWRGISLSLLGNLTHISFSHVRKHEKLKFKQDILWHPLNKQKTLCWGCHRMC